MSSQEIPLHLLPHGITLRVGVIHVHVLDVVTTVLGHHTP